MTRPIRAPSDATSTRRAIIFSLIAASSLPRLALAQTPTGRSIRLILPAAPGSSTDLTGRVLGEALQAELGQAVWPDNKPGAATAIGSEQLARSAPDGHTLGVLPIGSLAINPSLFKQLRYNPASDFTPLAFIGHTPTLMVTRAAGPYQSVEDIVRAAQAAPGKLNYASSGNATTSHIAGEFLKKLRRLEIHHVPYRNAASLIAVMSGEADFVFYHPAAVMPLVKSGKLRVLGVSSAKRSSTASDAVPLIEQGFPGFDLTAWYMLVGPRGLSPDLKAKLGDATMRALARPTTVKLFQEQGVEKWKIPQSRLQEFIDAEGRKWAELVQLTGIKVD